MMMLFDKLKLLKVEMTKLLNTRDFLLLQIKKGHDPPLPPPVVVLKLKRHPPNGLYRIAEILVGENFGKFGELLGNR